MMRAWEEHPGTQLEVSPSEQQMMRAWEEHPGTQLMVPDVENANERLI